MPCRDHLGIDQHAVTIRRFSAEEGFVWISEESPKQGRVTIKDLIQEEGRVRSPYRLSVRRIQQVSRLAAAATAPGANDIENYDRSP